MRPLFLGFVLGEVLPKSPSWMIGFIFAGTLIFGVTAILWLGGIEIQIAGGAPNLVFHPRLLLGALGCAILFWSVATMEFCRVWFPGEKADWPTFSFLFLALGLLLVAYWPRKNEKVKI